jgi:dienelactone hydrolase
MSGGHAVVADFGIATALQNAGVARLTETGISVGSPTYMSPEQAAGERDLDERTDVYSLACVLYELLTGQSPAAGASQQELIRRKLNGDYARVRELRADVPVPLDAAIDKALSADRAQRTASMDEFARAIVDAVPHARPTLRRVLWMTAAAAALILVVGTGWWRHERRIVTATQQIAEVQRLATNGQYAAAFALAEELRKVIPRDSTLLRLRPTFTDFIKIVTKPAGARVSQQRVDTSRGSWEVIGTTPLIGVPMPKYGLDLNYRLRIEHEGYELVEVLPNRFFRADSVADTVRLDPIGEWPGMARIPGSAFRGLLVPDSTPMADYHIDRYEVTNREYMRFIEAGGYAKREYWTESFVSDGKTLTWDEAAALLRDHTGLPGPATWSNGKYPEGQADYPVGGVSWYEAAAYARFVGKRLPTWWHWTRAGFQFEGQDGWMVLPTSNITAAEPRRVGLGLPSTYGLYDMAGNVREWMANPAGSGHLTLGGAWDDADYQVLKFMPKPEFDRAPGNGFRLAKYIDADSVLARIGGPISPVGPGWTGLMPTVPARDFRKVRTVSDAEFASLLRMYDYDHVPLNARRDSAGPAGRYRWEKVSFAAAYGSERMAAYIYVDTAARPPYEPVIVWPGSGAMTARAFNPRTQNITRVAFILRSGRALVFPLYKGSFERDDSTFSVTISVPDSSVLYRDLSVQWVKDLRRTIDYLETRNDMRADRVGYYGLSWGAENAPKALVVETRIKAAVLDAAGYWLWGTPRPEVEAANYSPRMRTPTLVFSGKFDQTFPFEISALPFFQQLGSRDKKHVVVTSGHATIPVEILSREGLAWYDFYLSGKGPKP